MERICKICKHFVVTGISFDKTSKHTQEFGVCQKPRGNAKKIRGKLIGGDFMWDDETCKAFKRKKQTSSRCADKN